MRKEETEDFEARRRRGMRMLASGASQADVVHALGVTRQTASRWAKMLAEGSRSWRAGKRGHPSRLTEQQLRSLDRLVRGRDPQEHGLTQYRWSVALVRDLIEREFGVSYESIPNVRRILREMGLFPGYGRRRIMMHRAHDRWKRDGKPVPW
ncbi:winged helix-turn-helix domain-containing protein [Burkholderia gladioli]|uniref:winged helix-turn-helix domain-containing protein n=1 Tax=Burkholderia gladioli TaxID=28095 RepID=UPI00163E512E